MDAVTHLRADRSGAKRKLKPGPGCVARVRRDRLR
jgi:hypothetical protein